MEKQFTDKVRLYKSRYIVDVSVSRCSATLVDSSGVKYILKDDIYVKCQFKTWFNTVFSKGIPQHLTVFECERKEADDHDVIYEVSKFLNVEVEGGK